jgi:MFS superfamily sulfate permease-like transporter
VKYNFSPLANWRYDLPASVVVFLVALPLCLGIAMASGAPLFSGIIAGIIGGVVIGLLSKSPLSVSGPAAGLTVIVLEAIQTLPSFEAFLLAVCIAGLLQILFGILRAGVIGDFIPSSVIIGMLAAIGLILILKQLPHAVGFDVDYVGSESFVQKDGRNTLSTFFEISRNYISLGATLISSISLVFLFWWDKRQKKIQNWLRYVPGPLVVVIFGILANHFFQIGLPAFALASDNMVSVPVTNSLQEFLRELRFPDFQHLNNQAVWITALTLALVASIETLLSIEAVDKLDPFKRVTPTNRELMAQGVGNLTSGFIGGLPITSVIVRSSANVSAGGRTKLSAISHGLLLLLCVIAIPSLLNRIPLSALAAILIAVGYKLVKPTIFIRKYQKGPSHFIPFSVTVVSIVLTDLLMGIGIGVIVGAVFVLLQNFRSSLMLVADGNNYLLRCKKDLFFLHKYELKRALNTIPEDSSLLIDITRVGFIDRDNIEIINDFIDAAEYRDIRVSLKTNKESAIANLFRVSNYETA